VLFQDYQKMDKKCTDGEPATFLRLKRDGWPPFAPGRLVGRRTFAEMVNRSFTELAPNPLLSLHHSKREVSILKRSIAVLMSLMTAVLRFSDLCGDDRILCSPVRLRRASRLARRGSGGGAGGQRQTSSYTAVNTYSKEQAWKAARTPPRADEKAILVTGGTDDLSNANRHPHFFEDSTGGRQLSFYRGGAAAVLTTGGP
jgi:hypothetical protein